MIREIYERLTARVRYLLTTNVAEYTETWLEYPSGAFPPPFVVICERVVGTEVRRFHLYTLTKSDEMRERGA